VGQRRPGCNRPPRLDASRIVVTAEVFEGRAQRLLIYAEKKGGAANA
jgi:hypothetical protein